MEIIKNFRAPITFDDLKDGAVFLYRGDIYLKVDDNEIGEEEKRAGVILESVDYSRQFEVKLFSGNIIIDKLYSTELYLYD